MSSDLELPPLDLPLLKLPWQTERDGVSGQGAIIGIADGELQPDHDDGCRTPTSEEHRIPALTTCPPVRKKMTGRKRRRTSEVHLHKDMAAVNVSHEEIEEFFHRIEHVRDRERVQVVVKGSGVGKKVLLQLR